MPTLTLIQGSTERKIHFEGEVPLSALLEDAHAHVDRPCGGKGTCRKCAVTVDGKAELACQYILRGDATVVLPDKNEIVSVTGTLETDRPTENLCLCLDIGTTTLALALVSLDEGQTVRTLTSKNPQRAF
ncbi:MAG: 2Fe-2S iron-sulfur cluster binding domain-containing protein, partial [Clostridia bacterium]|nr:2Fe-2S iron-sulfur cluster binding domain-containing protein [Clostridia bacterium]